MNIDLSINETEAFELLKGFGYSPRSVGKELGLPDKMVSNSIKSFKNPKNRLFIIGCLSILKEKKAEDIPVKAVVTAYDNEKGVFTQFHDSDKVKLWRVRNNRSIPHIRMEIEGEESVKIYNPMTVVYFD